MSRHTTFNCNSQFKTMFKNSTERRHHQRIAIIICGLRCCQETERSSKPQSSKIWEKSQRNTTNDRKLLFYIQVCIQISWNSNNSFQQGVFESFWELFWCYTFVVPLREKNTFRIKIMNCFQKLLTRNKFTENNAMHARAKCVKSFNICAHQ